MYIIHTHICMFIRSRYENLEIKAEMLISSHIHLLMSNPNVSFQSTAKIKELASLFQYFWRGVYMYIIHTYVCVYIYIYIYIY